jgi:hypothetical protein
MGLVRFRVRRAYPGYGRGVAADVRPRTRSITVHSWRNLGLAMRGRLSRAWCPPDGGSTARGSGRKRTTRSRLAAALGCRRQRATQKFGRTQIGARDADPSAPPARPPQADDAPLSAYPRIASLPAQAGCLCGSALNHLYHFCENGSRPNPPKRRHGAKLDSRNLLFSVV